MLLGTRGPDRKEEGPIPVHLREDLGKFIWQLVKVLNDRGSAETQTLKPKPETRIPNL